MEEQTSIITKNGKHTPESQAFGITIRAWIVIMLTIAICGNWVANSIMANLGYTSANFTVPEPIYTVFISAISYYYGTQKMKGMMENNK